MAKENKVEYERVDEEGDNYRRILVKFNPRLLRGPEFVIEFVPLENAIRKGKIFVRNVDSVSTIDLNHKKEAERKTKVQGPVFRVAGYLKGLSQDNVEVIS